MDINPTGQSVTFAPHQEHLEEEQTVCMEDNGPLGGTDEEEDQLSDTLFMINEYRDEKDTTPPSCSIETKMMIKWRGRWRMLSSPGAAGRDASFLLSSI